MTASDDRNKEVDLSGNDLSSPDLSNRDLASRELSPGAKYLLRLYVAGETPKSQAAIRNLQALCTTHLAGQFSIEVIDLRANPQMASVDQILAIPTLVRRLPEPLRRVIGDLSDAERVLVGLDIWRKET